ncbi:HAD family hydrolase [Sinomonas halotolerans]|uniref:HAD family hydrolase n=1 Tax=Sinomonas halotolerans TaxID=1644133 RepID=A0ABU9X190_9MICC
MASSPTAAAAPPYDAVILSLEAVVAGRVLGEAVSGGVPLPESAPLLDRLRAGRVPIAVATSSPDAQAALAEAGLGGLADTVVDGERAKALRLPDAPDPALFLEAARRLGVDPHRAVVIDESPAGMEAGRRGGFGLVVGIDRRDRRAELEARGADVVLGGLRELDLGLVLTDPWLLVYEGTDPAHEGHREALTAQGNGYAGVRGAAPESGRGGIGYPGTYLAGVYNRVVNAVEGLESEDEHMVNAPNWLHLDLRLQGGAWWSEGGLTLRAEHRTLDLRTAVSVREVLLEDDDGRQLRVRQRRFVSMAEPHLMALETTLTALGWSGAATVRSGVDVDVSNENVLEDAFLAHRHLRDLTVLVDPGVTDPGLADAGLADPGRAGSGSADVIAVAETLQSHTRIAVALRHRVRGGDPGSPGGTGGRDVSGAPGSTGGLHFRVFRLELADGIPATVEKTAVIATSRDRAVSSAASGACAVLERSQGGFDALLREHAAAWRRLLQLYTVRLEASPQVQLVLNLHVFHLLQTLTPFTAALDAGVPARGLHGEGYRGHVFWDELFVLPLVTSRQPAVARALISYRSRRLPAARHAAAQLGLDGALFPWQSGSDGREETPHWIFNRRSGHWIPDRSRLQRHVGLAVAFNAWQYFEATRDRQWLLDDGAALIVEVARLFASMAEHDPVEDRYHLRGVMGPDEYHTGYPGRPDEGVDDNAYTNVMASWVCRQACHILAVVHGHDGAEVRERLGISPGEPALWERLSRRISVPFHGDGIMSQFAGFGALEELDWEHYRRTYGNIERLDLILESEGDSPNRYQLTKQADALMLLYLLGQEELIAVLGRLGYTVTPEQLSSTVDYYLARTAHGSTLSRVAHASVLAAMDPQRAWDTFREALDADLDDTQGGTTRTGIHLGAMAGTIDVVQRSFAGLRLTADALVFSPRMPAGLGGIAFHVRYRGHLLEVALRDNWIRVSSAPGDAEPIRVRLGSVESLVRPGGEHRFDLTRGKGE